MTEGGSVIGRVAAMSAHESFYKAFATRDFEAMDGLWARECGVTCLHPNWPPLFDRREIMESWKAIFENTEDLRIRPYDPRHHSYGGWYIVVCLEELGGQWLAAANIYAWEDAMLKIVHHQAGPTSGAPLVDLPPPSDRVH